MSRFVPRAAAEGILRFVIYAGLCVTSIIFLFPFYWLVVSAF